MLSVADMQAALDAVSYKAGWGFTAFRHSWEGPAVAITATLPDTYGTGTVDLRITTFVSPNDLESEQTFLRWLMWRMARIEVHEMREFFKVEGRIVSDPHAEGADAEGLVG